MRNWLLIFVVFFLLADKVKGQCPQNIGFEEGTFSKWQCYSGDINTEGQISLQPVLPTDGIHTIQSASSQPKRDPYGNFPVLCPNGSNYSVKLGNNKSLSGAEAMAYTFDIPPGQAYTLILNYAVVLQNPNHKDFEQPKFAVKLYNVTDNNYIDCSSFNFVSSADLPGFKKASSRTGAADVLYKDWSSTSINLVGYEGKRIRMELTTNDCSKGGHFGYAYFDIIENCSTPITGNTYCSGQTSVTLLGPDGFASYKWFNDDDPSRVIDTGKILKLTPAPADGTHYTLKIDPYFGVGCSDVLHTTINKINSGFSFSAADTIFVCKGNFADLSTAISAGTTPGLRISYFTDPDLTKYVESPKAIATQGTYYISAVSNEGCINILPVYVKEIDLLQLNIPDIHVAYPEKADLSKAFTQQPHTQYQFFSNEEATEQLSTFYAVDAGRYYVKTITDLGCETVSSIKVIADPPPPYVISAPTAFTPNADGVNDNFSISIKGYLSLEKLRIYNRYGTILFEAKTGAWDGTSKGHVVAPGTYYWLFDGRSDYDGSKVTKTGVVTVIK